MNSKGMGIIITFVFNLSAKIPVGQAFHKLMTFGQYLVTVSTISNQDDQWPIKTLKSIETSMFFNL